MKVGSQSKKERCQRNPPRRWTRKGGQGIIAFDLFRVYNLPMSLENRPGQPSQWAPVDPRDYLSNYPEKNIMPSDAYRSSIGMLKELNSLGINLAQPCQLQVFKSVRPNDLIGLVEEITLNNNNDTNKQQSTTYTFYTVDALMKRISTDVPHSVLLRPFLNSELIVEQSAKWTPHSNSIFEAHMDFADQPFRLVTRKEPNGQIPYELSLVMPTHIPKNQEVSLDLLPLNFRSVGFSYDFLRNPEHRERTSEFSERRVEMDMVMVREDLPFKQSGIFGHQTPNGINAILKLYLQTPNPSHHLKCYEVELFGLDGKKNLDNTQEIVPESDWQEKERHYCMTGDKETLTYPLFPIKELGTISTLVMEVHYDAKRDDPRRVHKLLQGFPLSVDGQNQWYATGYLGDGNVELLFKPEWGEDNARLVYRKSSKERISAEQIHSAVVGLSSLKNAVAERLSV